MKIIIPGGSGHVGTVLANYFNSCGHEVVILSRKLPQNYSPSLLRTVLWDGETLGDWRHEFEGADAIINLAGRSVNCRYGAVNRREILRSRTESTRVVGEAIALCDQPPCAWLQMSTATIYAHRYDDGNDERTGILGGSEQNLPDTWRFSYDVAYAWERAFDEALTARTRKVTLRLAMLMSPESGGTFDLLLRLVRLGLGGRVGDGRQYISWIHDRDLCSAIAWLTKRDDIAGIVNLAAPQPLPQAEFMREIRKAWGRSIGLPASRWMLELGCWLMRTESELILKSRRVLPGRLQEAGFAFEFPTWSAAARDLCGRHAAHHQPAAQARVIGSISKSPC